MAKVPGIFISSHFDLADEKLFNSVFPWSEIESSKQRSNKLLQEQVLIIPE